MAYCTQADILIEIPEETLIRLTDDEELDVVAAAAVTQAIAAADAEIDYYCAGKGAPFSAPIPAIIKSLSIPIAVYKLYSRRVEEIPPTRERNYQEAQRILWEIYCGGRTVT